MEACGTRPKAQGIHGATCTAVGSGDPTLCELIGVGFCAFVFSSCAGCVQVLYTIPTGSNPAGCTQSTERKQANYAICREHDILILEDDPYYYMQA